METKKKPLFRFTCGPCLPQGIEVLCESINKTTTVLGLDRFDWVVCHNGLSTTDIETIKAAIGDLPIDLFEQSWEHLPIRNNLRSPKREDGSYEWNGNKCGGTLWKVCPARMRLNSHEIIMDNDIVLLKKFRQVDQFLRTTNMALILEEPIRFYGRYDKLFDRTKAYLNSGFMGLPPGYDFAAEIHRVWEETGRLENLSQADEQGLLTYTLSRIPSLRVKKEQMKEILARDVNYTITGEEEGLHFTQSNRIAVHISWKKYKDKNDQQIRSS